MERLKVPAAVQRAAGSQVSRRDSGQALAMRTVGHPPKISNRLTDVEIPMAVWSAWRPANGERQIRRPLTDQERAALVARRDELAPAVAPYHPSELDHVALALLDMYGGFTSMRQGEEDAAARVASIGRLLADYPGWAIKKACIAIRTNGVWREGKFDRRWPPNDSEIIAEVRGHVRMYADQHRNAVALLSATVEDA